jgi:hypothetical protein
MYGPADGSHLFGSCLIYSYFSPRHICSARLLSWPFFTVTGQYSSMINCTAAVGTTRQNVVRVTGIWCTIGDAANQIAQIKTLIVL